MLLCKIVFERMVDNMFDLIKDVSGQLENTLNQSPFSVNSIEGVLVLLLIAFMIYNIINKSFKFVKFSVGLLLIIEIGYCLSLTGFNNIIPLNEIFKYDVLTSLAQLCVGTKLSDILLKIDASFIVFFQQLWNLIVQTRNDISYMIST